MSRWNSVALGWWLAGALALDAGALPGVSHSIRMSPDQRGVEPAGMIAPVNVNGKVLRLLVDTGATRILLSSAAASRARVAPMGEVRIYGVGSGRPRLSRRARVQSIRFESLELRDTEVDIADAWFPPGVDGLLGPSVFKGYVVRLDSLGRRLDLLPVRSEAATAGPRDHFLLVPVELGGGGKGLFLLDTGADHSIVDESLAKPPWETATPLIGIGGPARAKVLGPMEFTLSGLTLVDRNVLSADLSELRRRSGRRIAGLIGFPALRRAIVTIDYERGSVGIEPAR